MSTPVLEVRDLSIDAGTGRRAVRPVEGISFAIDEGSKLAVVGESGSGKSITALAVMRLLRKPLRTVGGEVWLAGRDLLRLSEREMVRVRGREAAMIYQDPMSSLNPVRTIGAQIEEAVIAAGVTRKASVTTRTIDLLGEVGMPSPRQRLGAYPHEFSGGMRQRVMIAMAMAGEPRLLIADEPTTALDVTTQARILALLGQMAEDHRTSVLFITHDMGVASEFCDEVQIMYAGQVVERGRTQEVLRGPAHHYARALVRSIPQLDDPVDVPLRSIPGQPPLPSDFPDGCRFAARCDHAASRCREEPPLLREIGERTVRCHYPADPSEGVWGSR